MNFENSLQQALGLVGEYIVREAQHNLENPSEDKKSGGYDQGTLHRSISWRIVPGENAVEIGVFRGMAAMEYAPFVEFGTGIHAVHGDGRKTPWLFPNKDHKYSTEIHYKTKPPKTVTPDWMYTHGRKPCPFLGPALRDNEEQIKQIILNAIINGENMKND